MNIQYLRPSKQPAIKLHTVNVIEITDGGFQSLSAFVDNPQGNKRAEKLFRQKIETFEKENKTTPSDEEDFENYLDDGIYDVFPGFTLILTHSV